jgi:hypothetical protein
MCSTLIVFHTQTTTIMIILSHNLVAQFSSVWYSDESIMILNEQSQQQHEQKGG